MRSLFAFLLSCVPLFAQLESSKMTIIPTGNGTAPGSLLFQGIAPGRSTQVNLFSPAANTLDCGNGTTSNRDCGLLLGTADLSGTTTGPFGAALSVDSPGGLSYGIIGQVYQNVAHSDGPKFGFSRKLSGGGFQDWQIGLQDGTDNTKFGIFQGGGPGLGGLPGGFGTPVLTYDTAGNGTTVSITCTTTPCGGANGLVVSPTAPLFVYAHFTDTDENTLRISISRDGANWQPISHTGIFHGTGLRDPSITIWNGKYCFITSAAGTTPTLLQYFCTPDLTTLPTFTSTLNIASYVSGATAGWAPEFDISSGSPGFWVAISTQSNPFNNVANSFTPYFFFFDPTTGSVSGATPVTLNNTTNGRTFDYFPYYDGVNHYLFYVDQQPGGTISQPIAYATASTQLGTYTQQTTHGADFFGFGNSFQTEAPAVFKLGNGCIEIMADTWLFPPQGGRHYSPWYKLACGAPGSLFSTMSTAGPINIPRSEHGTVLAVTNPAQAAIVYTAAGFYQTDSAVFGGVGINTTGTPLYPLTIKATLASSGGILYPEPAAIGLDPGDGHYGTISVCGQIAQGCWQGIPGSGRLFQYYTGDSGFGMFQFINAIADTAEASIMLCDGCSQPGSVPVSTSASGDKSIWTLSVNNQALDLGHNNQRFSIFNKGINNFPYGSTGGFPLELDPTTGEAHINYGITLGFGKQSAYGHNNQADIWSSGANIIEMGDGFGPFSDHSAEVRMRWAVLDFPFSNVNLTINGVCGATGTSCFQRNIWFSTGSNISSSALRWAISVRNNENSGNTGSDIYFDRLADSGAFISPSPMWISRANGNVIIHELSADMIDAPNTGNATGSITCTFATVSGVSVCTGITSNLFVHGIRTN